MKQDDSSNILGFQRNIFTASLLKVFSGWLSDRTGHRKWLMALGYGISTLSGLLWDRIGPSATFLFGTGLEVLNEKMGLSRTSGRSILPPLDSYLHCSENLSLTMDVRI